MKGHTTIGTKYVLRINLWREGGREERWRVNKSITIIIINIETDRGCIIFKFTVDILVYLQK